MAILHKATVTPTKRELLERALGGPVTVFGTYRFDDPDGEVGVEAFIVESGTTTRQVVWTYRGAPLDAAGEHLVATMEHSVLGRRWVYNGCGDPVALACFRRALLGQQQQATEELWDRGERVGLREPSVQLALANAATPTTHGNVTLVSALDEHMDQTHGARLMARWAGGEGVVAILG